MSEGKEEQLKALYAELAEAARQIVEAERARDAANWAYFKATQAWDEARRKVRAIEGEP